jgi:hypothetical protein
VVPVVDLAAGRIVVDPPVEVETEALAVSRNRGASE